MMEIINLEEDLKNNSYPGRGIAIGKSEDGENAVIAYFIMGRSENSRNRIFIEDEDGIKTQAFDISKLVDPSLIIYSPVKVYNNFTIVTNGDQTDTIQRFLMSGKSFEDALETRFFEPDEPNFTPRISGIVELTDNNFKYTLSILKNTDGNPENCERLYYNYNSPKSGEGHLIHTYKFDGNPVIPSYEGEPKTVDITGDIDTFTNTLWESLNNENKVSLFTRFISLKTGITETRIINKNV